CSEVCVEFVAVLDALRRHYLFLYNLLQFLGFSWTVSLLTANLILHGEGALYSAFSSCAAVLYVCQMLAVLEVINAAVGLVKTPVFPAMIQARLSRCVMGRNVVLFVVFGSLPEMQERSVVFWVFYLWSISEVFRLAFPVLSLTAKFRILIWLRHALLYPLTTLTEVPSPSLLLRFQPHHDATGTQPCPCATGTQPCPCFSSSSNTTAPLVPAPPHASSSIPAPAPPVPALLLFLQFQPHHSASGSSPTTVPPVPSPALLLWFHRCPCSSGSSSAPVPPVTATPRCLWFQPRPCSSGSTAAPAPLVPAPPRHLCFQHCPGAVSAVAVLQSLPLFDQSRLFSVPLPEAVGFSVSFSFSLRLYLLLMFFGETENDFHFISCLCSAKSKCYTYCVLLVY
ncbi:hypothetical protein QTP70_032994, partial [Hemibagrus guttatus]